MIEVGFTETRVLLDAGFELQVLIGAGFTECELLRVKSMSLQASAYSRPFSRSLGSVSFNVCTLVISI